MLKTKSVHSPIEPADGLRILATRLRGRGLPGTRYDAWMASLGPSEQLLRRVQRGKIGWPAFRRRYLDNLLHGPAAAHDPRSGAHDVGWNRLLDGAVTSFWDRQRDSHR